MKGWFEQYDMAPPAESKPEKESHCVIFKFESEKDRRDFFKAMGKTLSIQEFQQLSENIPPNKKLELYYPKENVLEVVMISI